MECVDEIGTLYSTDSTCRRVTCAQRTGGGCRRTGDTTLRVRRVSVVSTRQHSVSITPLSYQDTFTLLLQIILLQPGIVNATLAM